MKNSGKLTYLANASLIFKFFPGWLWIKESKIKLIFILTRVCLNKIWKQNIKQNKTFQNNIVITKRCQNPCWSFNFVVQYIYFTFNTYLKWISLRKRFQFTVSVWSWQPQNVCTIFTPFHRRVYRRGLSFLFFKKYLYAAIYPSVLPSLLDIFVIWVWRNGKTIF